MGKNKVHKKYTRGVIVRIVRGPYWQDPDLHTVVEVFGNPQPISVLLDFGGSVGKIELPIDQVRIVKMPPWWGPKSVPEITVRVPEKTEKKRHRRNLNPGPFSNQGGGKETAPHSQDRNKRQGKKPKSPSAKGRTPPRNS